MAMYWDYTKLQKTLKIVAEDESFVPHVYKDSEGYWTIGHGILVDERRGGGITESESMFIMRNRLDKLISEIHTRWEWTRELSWKRQSALLQMAYNLGIGGLSRFNKMFAALKTRDYPLAAQEALDSKWATQVGDRAKRIAKLIDPTM